MVPTAALVPRSIIVARNRGRIELHVVSTTMHELQLIWIENFELRLRRMQGTDMREHVRVHLEPEPS